MPAGTGLPKLLEVKAGQPHKGTSCTPYCLKGSSQNVSLKLLSFFEKLPQQKINVSQLMVLTVRYSVCSLVVPRLEEAILTPVLKKNFKRPLILGQEGHNYPPKHSNLSYDQFGVRLEQSDTAPPLLPPGWRDTDSFSWICSVFNSSISRRS